MRRFEPLGGHLGDAVARRSRPRSPGAGPVVRPCRPARRRTRPGRRPRLGRPVARAQPHAQLVPLDLVGDERGDEVVEVRRGGQQHGHRALAVVVPAPPAGGRLERRPLVQRPDPVPREHLGLLAHDDHARGRDRVGQPADGVQEGAEVELVRARERVQARGHRAVRGLEHPQQRLAAGAQQRRVRAVVELHLVGDLRGDAAERAVARRAGARDAQAGSGHPPGSISARRGSRRRRVAASARRCRPRRSA